MLTENHVVAIGEGKVAWNYLISESQKIDYFEIRVPLQDV